ncbi:MAG: sigma-70 family RNA polymerase sigma factor [Bacteroidaceae bacterium]|jgi:RNA polymerase sigma-70 factor (ECF subfamily)|nr:sigma-70 family RNA polymerase sigma factor [Bacteroidaceae bacterium]
MMTKSEYEIAMQRLRPMLIAEATKYLGDANDAEDMVQDAMMRLWQMCSQLHSPVDGLARILVRNLCLDTIRRRKPREGIEALPAAIGNSNEAVEHERIERMMSVVESLPDVPQTILRLRHMEGMEMKDIARLLQMEEAAVRKALSRARQAVREKLTIDY